MREKESGIFRVTVGECGERRGNPVHKRNVCGL